MDGFECHVLTAMKDDPMRPSIGQRFSIPMSVPQFARTRALRFGGGKDESGACPANGHGEPADFSTGSQQARPVESRLVSLYRRFLLDSFSDTHRRTLSEEEKSELAKGMANPSPEDAAAMGALWLPKAIAHNPIRDPGQRDGF
jgi:hypothetical protein